jgi:hypothetical protein
MQFPSGDSGKLFGHTSVVVISGSISQVPLFKLNPSGQALSLCCAEALFKLDPMPIITPNTSSTAATNKPTLVFVSKVFK